jgi:hypothetical protein
MSSQPVFVKIFGEDATSAAFRSVLGGSEKSARAMEKIFRGAFGNIGGAAGAIGRHLGGIRTLLGVGGIAGAVGLATAGFTALYGKVKASREEHERINDLAERLDLPSAKVKQYSEEWAKVATSLRDAARGFAELNDAQSRAFGALGLDPEAAGAIDSAKTRIAAASGSKEDKVDVLRILTGLSYEEAEKELERELKRLNEVVGNDRRGGLTRRHEREDVEFGKEDIGALRRSGAILAPAELKAEQALFDALEKMEAARRKSQEDSAKESARIAEEDRQRRIESGELWTDAYSDMVVAMQADVNDTLEAGSEFAVQVGQDALAEFDRLNDESRNAHSEMTEFALQAARNMQDAFAQFLFDPFHDGLKGMLKGFIDMIRQMVANAAAAKIFDSLGGVGAIGGGLGKLFGFATGGSFKVGGSGGTDSSLVAFKATPGEMVDVRTPGQARGGGATIHMHNDFRGATVDAIKLFQASVPAIIRQAIDGARMAVRDDRSRGYA